MKNWKIGLRITAGFGTIVLTTIVLGMFALNRVGNIQKQTQELDSNYFPSVLALGNVQSNLYFSVVKLLRINASSDPQLVRRLQTEIATLRAEDDKNLKFYESTAFTDEQSKMYAECAATRANFIAEFDEVEKVGESTDPAQIAKAQTMFEQQLTPIYVKYRGELQVLVDMNKTGAKNGMTAISGAVSSTTQGIWVGVACCLLFSVPIAIYIVRGITQPLSLAVEALKKVAGSDLTARMEVSSRDEIGQMAVSLNEAVERLNSTMQEVADSAANASSSAQQLASASEAIASGAQEQAASLEETSASLEEITAAVRQSADNANQASQLATSSKDSAEAGQQVVSNAITAMAEINGASAKISDIISTIDEIAFQTNLLAVNAAVEAARAGDEGRGFAVVASEVRSLAQRSAVAAKEIKVLIQDSLKKVDAGSELVNRSGETLRGIVGSVKRVTDIVGEIAAASGEQSTGIEQVNTAVTQMDQVTQSNSAQTEELSATAQSLSEQAANLMELVSTFTLTNSERGSRHRQPLQPRALRPAHSVGASLVQAANGTLMQSAPHPSAAAQRSGKPIRSSSAKPTARSRASKGSIAQQPAVVAVVANGSSASDDSFEEF